MQGAVTTLRDITASWYRAGAVMSPRNTIIEPTDKFVRVPIGFPTEAHEWLRERAFRGRTTMAEIVRDAVREYRDRHDPQLGLPLRPGEEVGDR